MARRARQSQIALTLFSNNFTYDAKDSVRCSLSYHKGGGKTYYVRNIL